MNYPEAILPLSQDLKSIDDYYDMVRHESAYIPDIVVLNPAIDALEHVLKQTFPI